MKPKLLRIGDDLIAVRDVSQVGRSTQPLQADDRSTVMMDGVRFRLRDGTESSYHGPGLWEAVEAWLHREAEVIPFSIKKSGG